MSILPRIALFLALGVGSQFAIPELIAEASYDSDCRRKKRKKRKKRRKKVTAKTIKRWQKAGYTTNEIVEKAGARGYRLTRRGKRKLRRYRVKRSIIRALAAAQDREDSYVVIRSSKATKRPIDLEDTVEPDEIDFDSVPPPEGMPSELAHKHKTKKKKKGLNTSMRPSAPFKPSSKKAPLVAKDKKAERKVFAASE